MRIVPPFTLAVPMNIPSQNQRDKWHWRRRHQETQRWEIFIRAAVRSLPERPTTKSYLRILSMRAALIHDDANLRGGSKGCTDALVRLGFIRDDSDDWVHITYRQMQTPKPLRCTRISFLPPPATNPRTP